MAGRHIVAAVAVKFVEIAELVVNAPGGNVELYVPMAAGIIGNVGSVRLNGSIVAQADNVHTDVNGSVRGFMLSGSALSSGTYVISVSAAQEGAAAVAFEDTTELEIVTGADTYVAATATTFSSTDAVAAGVIAYWRQGPVVTEGVYLHEVVSNPLRARFLIAKWANGNSKSSVAIENAYAVPGAGHNNPTNSAAPRTLKYTAVLTRGAETKTYSTAFLHGPYARWLRYFGHTEAHASLQPLGWSGTAKDGHGRYFRATAMVQNFTDLFPMLEIDWAQSTAPGSPSVNDRYTPDTPFQKTLSWSGSAWVMKDENQSGLAFLGSNTGTIGPFTCSQGQPGGNADIAAHPAYNLAAMDNYDADGKTLMCWPADRRQENPIFWRLTSTKKFPRFDDESGGNPINWTNVGVWATSTSFIGGARSVLNLTDLTCTEDSTTVHSDTGGFTSNLVGYTVAVYGGTNFRNDIGLFVVTSVTDGNNIVLDRTPCTEGNGTAGQALFGYGYHANQMFESAHVGASFYLPYITTGRYWYYEGQLAQEIWNFFSSPPGEGSADHFGKGVGMFRHAFGCYWTDDFWDNGAGFAGWGQERHMGWAVRTTAHTCACTIDDDVKNLALFGFEQAMARELWGNVQSGCYNCSVTVALNDTGRFVQPGFSRYQSEGGPTVSWMQYTGAISLGMAHEVGELTADGLGYAAWLLDGWAYLYAQTDYPVIKEYFHGSSNMWTTQGANYRNWNTPEIVPHTTWHACYDDMRANHPGAASWPVKTTANYHNASISGSDWMGGHAAICVYAAQTGSAYGIAAVAWHAAAAQHYEGHPYWDSKVHYLTVRS